MEASCSIEKCQNPADCLCQCNNIYICEMHTITHVATPGNHQITHLKAQIPNEMKKLLTLKLIEFSQILDDSILNLRKQVKVTTESLYKNLNMVVKSLQSLKSQCFNSISSFESITHIYKSSENYFDKLLLSNNSFLLAECSTWKPPTLEYPLPIPLTNIKLSEDCIPFSSLPDENRKSIILQLQSLNNKMKLHEYAQMIKSQKASHEVLLDIIRSTAYKNEHISISWKAFTVLSKIGFDFSGLNLQGIKAQHSEVIGGKFVNTNFQGSNFQQAKLNLSVIGPALLNFNVLKSIERGKKCFEGHKGKVNALQFSKDGRFLVSGSDDCCLKIWELSSGHCLNTLEGHTDSVLCIDISNDVTEIISGGKDGIIKLWDTTTGACLANYQKQAQVPLGLVISVVLTSDKELIIAGTWNQEVLVWKKDGMLLRSFNAQSAVWAVACPSHPNQDGSFLIFVGNRKGELIVFKTNTDKAIWNSKDAHQQWLSNIIVSSNGKTLITTGCDGMIKCWKVPSHKHLSKIFSISHYNLIKETKANDGGIFMLKAGGKSIFSVARKTVNLWSKKDQTLLGSFRAEKEISGFGVNSNGSLFAYSEEEIIHIKQTLGLFL